MLAIMTPRENTPPTGNSNAEAEKTECFFCLKKVRCAEITLGPGDAPMCPDCVKFLDDEVCLKSYASFVEG